jgi:adenylate cyclase
VTGTRRSAAESGSGLAKKRRGEWSRSVRFGLAIGLVGAFVAPFTSRVEEVGLDLLFRLRGPRGVPSEVMIVSVDKDSADALQVEAAPGTWPRSLHARLAEGLAQSGAAAIVFDFFFRDARDPSEDLSFAHAIRRADRVVLCCALEAEVIPLEAPSDEPAASLSFEGTVRPLQVLADSAVGVAPWPLPKLPAKISHFWTFKPGAGGTPTLPVVAFQAFARDAYPHLVALLEDSGACATGTFPKTTEEAYAAGDLQELVFGLREVFQGATLRMESLAPALERLQGRLPPDPRTSRLLASLVELYRGEEMRYLNYYGPARTVPTVSFSTALDRLDAGRQKGSAEFQGKAVFVGLSERSWPRQKDGFQTPYTRSDGLDLSGVEIAATAFANLLENQPIRPLAPPAHLGALLLWGLVVGAVALRVRAITALTALTVLSLGWAGTAVAAFDAHGAWYPLAVPLLFQAPLAFVGASLARYSSARREREELAEAAKYYLPEWLVDALGVTGPGSEIEEELVYAVCLMTDAKRYATVAARQEEQGGARELRRWINRYFEAVFGPILQRGGYVVDIAGDSMLSLWRSGPSDPLVREQACLAAVEVGQAVAEFNRSAGDHALPTRIGVDVGYVSLGSVGAVGRFAYRATGNAVIAASRLEGLNKHLGTDALASEPVVERLEGIRVRYLGEFLLVGLTKPLKAFELRGRREDDAQEQEELCTRFREALELFCARRWLEAAQAFEANIPDGPSAFYLRLCEGYRGTPPPAEWSGVIEMDQK